MLLLVSISFNISRSCDTFSKFIYKMDLKCQLSPELSDFETSWSYWIGSAIKSHCLSILIDDSFKIQIPLPPERYQTNYFAGPSRKSADNLAIESSRSLRVNHRINSMRTLRDSKHLIFQPSLSWVHTLHSSGFSIIWR